jgi:hypothetical protein
MKKYFLIGATFAVLMFARGENRTFSISSFSVSTTQDAVQNDTFSKIELGDIRSTVSAQNYGEPALPVISEIIEIPNQATITVTVTKKSYNQQKIEYPIFPLQKPVNKSFQGKRIFNYSKQAYNKNNYGDEQLVTVEILGNAEYKRYAKITIHPIKYNPAKKILRVYNKIEYTLQIAPQ